MRPTQLLLETLISLGVVFAADTEKFGLSPLGQMLVNGSYRNLGDEYWAHLPQFLATDQPIVKMDDALVYRAEPKASAPDLVFHIEPGLVTIDKSRHVLGYKPVVSCSRAMELTLGWIQYSRLLQRRPQEWH